MEVATGSCTTDANKGTWVVRFLSLHIAKGLPTAIGEADGVVEVRGVGSGIPACNGNDMEVAIINNCTTNAEEGTWNAWHLSIHIAKGRLPTAIGKADGVPQFPITSSNATDV